MGAGDSEVERRARQQGTRSSPELETGFVRVKRTGLVKIRCFFCKQRENLSVPSLWIIRTAVTLTLSIFATRFAAQAPHANTTTPFPSFPTSPLPPYRSTRSTSLSVKVSQPFPE